MNIHFPNFVFKENKYVRSNAEYVDKISENEDVSSITMRKSSIYRRISHQVHNIDRQKWFNMLTLSEHKSSSQYNKLKLWNFNGMNTHFPNIVVKETKI